DVHALDTVEETVDERAPVDPDLSDQRLAGVLQFRDTHGPPSGLPVNRLSLVQPQAKADSIIVLAAHWFPGAAYVREQREPRTQPPTKRLPLLREHRRDLCKSGSLGHFDWGLTLVDSRAQPGIGAAVEKNLDRRQIALADGHVKRRVVVDTALIRIGAK